MKAVIFDMDGTLLDSFTVWMKLLPNYLQKYGFTLTEEENRSLDSLPLEEAVEYITEKFPLGKTVEEVRAEIDEILFYHYKNTIPFKPYVKEYLDRLKNDGIPMCAATLNDRHLAEACLERLGLDEYLSFVITVGDVGKSKRDPKIYFECAKRLGCEPTDCVVFEDSLVAMETAYNNGFYVYGVYEKFQKYPENKEELRCHKFINSFAELIK